jgi:hypothetical protein
MRTRNKTPENVEIRIEKGIPCPPRGQYNISKYPWRTMKVGDSFLFPKHLSRQACYQSGAYHNNKNGGGKFAIRITPEGYRCWRVA